MQVKLGRSSVNAVEIVSGLNVGDQVILSDMSAWDAFDRDPPAMNAVTEEPMIPTDRHAARHQARRRHQGVRDRRSRNARARRASTWRSRAASTSSIAGPSGCGKSTLLSILGLLDSPSGGSYELNGRPVAELKAVGARARPQPRDRLHLPELQPDRRSLRVRERRAAAHLPRHAAGRAAAARRRGARARRHGAPREAPAEPALGRPAAARRRRARRRRRAGHPARRRADRQPRFEERRSR